MAGAAGPVVTVTTSRSDVSATVIDADFCLTADAAVAFPAPATIGITLSAPGFAPVTTVVMIDPAAIPVTIGTIALRPHPVRLQGRVVAAGTGVALPGARVLAIDDPSVTTPPPVHTLALSRPLNRPHPAGTTIDLVAVTGSGPPLALAQPAPLGDSELSLSDRSGLVADGVLGIIPTAAGDYVEYAQIVDPGPSPQNTPGTVALHDPLTLSLSSTAAVSLLSTSIGGAGTGTSLADASVSGDAIVAAAAVVSGLLCLDPGTNQEYRSVGAVCDTNGYWALDGVGHVASLWLGAEAAGYQSANQLIAVPFGAPVTFLDFKLT